MRMMSLVFKKINSYVQICFWKTELSDRRNY